MLLHVLLITMSITCRYMQLWLAALGGMILKLYHSYKVVKKIRDPSGERQYKAVLSVMNEFCQVGCRQHQFDSS